MHKTYIWDMTQLGADGDSAPWDHCHSCWLPAWATAYGHGLSVTHPSGLSAGVQAQMCSWDS
eukprot:scaffold230077_cov36-Attheya_sp.AAC.2